MQSVDNLAATCWFFSAPPCKISVAPCTPLHEKATER